VASSTEAPAPGNAGRRWVFAATLLGLGAVAVLGLSSLALDWQPARFWREPWRAWSAALVHLSGLHLAANLAGCALVGALGLVARVPQRSVTAWLVAWPLTQIALLARPDLDHYAGLSGVLHAGVAVVAVHLIATARGLRQAVGLAVLAALALKVAGESPFAADALRPREGWDIAIAPFAHAAGLAAGAFASALAEGLARSHAYHRSR
jgi:rhomboid family GlyGly-CTERM serine protease